MPIQGQEESAILLLNRADKDIGLVTPLLEKVGLQVLISFSADGALELFAKAGRSARLLIMDETVSPRAIPEFLDRVRSVNPHIPILVVSERDESEPAQGWVPNANVRGFLKKPFRRAKFLGSVLKLIGEPLARTA